MARDDDAPEFDDETTVIAGGQQAWSAVNGPAGGAPGERPEPSDDNTMVIAEESGPGRWEPGQREPGQREPDRPAIEAPRGQGAEQENMAPIVPPGPALVATGLGLLTKDGWVFQDINLTLRPSSVAAIVGPAGTGRSCLLLALSGRMAANTGTLTVSGHLMSDRPKSVRALTAVARIGSITGPEPGLTVRESIDEQCLLEDVDRQVGRTRFAEACEVMQVSFEPTLLVGRLAGALATLFAVALACVRVSAVILLDDLDRDVSAANQQRMLDALIRVARTGPTIVVTTTDRVPVMEADVVLDLTPRDGAAMWRPGPVIGPSGTMLRQLDPGGRQRDPVDLELESGTIPPPPEPPDSHDEWRDEWRDHQDSGTGDAPTEDQR